MQIGKLGDKETRRSLDCWCINSGFVVVVFIFWKVWMANFNLLSHFHCFFLLLCSHFRM